MKSVAKETSMKKLLLAIALLALLASCSKSPTGPAATVPDDIPLTLTSTGSSPAGTIVRIPDNTSYSWGDTVSLTAVPGPGYAFSGWSGDTIAISASLTIIMRKDMNVYANFINVSTGKKAFSINTISRNGSINFSSAGGVYDSGSVVSVKAIPDYGMKFSTWSGLLTTSDSVTFLVVSKNGTLTANFVIDPNAVFATLHVIPAPVNGKIVLSPSGVQSGNGYKFKPGTNVTITAEPDDNYELSSWGGSFSAFTPGLTSLTALMDSDYTVSAVFSKMPDGVVWTARTSGAQNGLLSAVWARNQIVVVGYGVILTSPDGVTWTTRDPGTGSCLNSVIFAQNQYVCVGDAGTILTSPDGITWTARQSPTTYGLESVIWTGSRFVAVGGEFVNSGLNYNNVITSTDGKTWTSANGGIGIWYGLASNGRTLVATGYKYDFTTVSDNSMSVMYLSGDGTSWAPGGNDIPEFASLNSIVWSGPSTGSGTGKFVAVGGSRDATYPFTSIYSSPNGTSWTEESAPTEVTLNGVTWTGNNYVAVGDGGVILTSSGNSDWKIQYSGTNLPIYGVAWTGSQCVAVGNSGMILTSP
jgi:uncharacterized repeat protein (TIGR02543 family)